MQKEKKAEKPEEKKLSEEEEKKRIEELRKKKKLTEKERIEIIKYFTKEILKKYGPLIRSVVLFGSTARGSAKEESDIDIFVILDDTKQHITPGMKTRIEDEMDIVAKKLSPLLSVQQPYLLTEFWRLVREGHPIVFNFIREGIAVYDKDIFTPIKRLLQLGEIKPSREAVEKFIERAPKRIRRVENAKIYMVVEDLYYAMLESAQAVLMFLGKTPPRPSEAPDVLRKTLVEMKLIDESLVKQLEDVIDLRKKVEHKQIKSLTGTQLDSWIEKAKKFVEKMESLIAKIEVLKRESMVEKSKAIMEETILTLLKAMRIEASKENLVDAFKKYIINAGLIAEKYLDVYNELERMHKLVKSGKILEIPKQDILTQREYVRKFLREAGKVLRKKLGEEQP